MEVDMLTVHLGTKGTGSHASKVQAAIVNNKRKAGGAVFIERPFV
jgi:hypothetical protein